MTTVTAQITYLLSERGRRDSLRKGGDGRRVQQDTGIVPDADLDAFTVNDDGEVVFDMTDTRHFDPDFNPLILPPADKGHVEKTEIIWDVVPTWDDLLAVVRGFKQEEDDANAARAAHLAHQARIAEEFLNDPNARPTRLQKGVVTIKGVSFYGNEGDAIRAEAQRRADADVEELRKQNRATLADWIRQHGTENQRQRLAAGLLPWTEAFSEAEDYLFGAAKRFPPYERFQVEEVCHCLSRAMEDTCCSPKFQSLDATELTAHEWAAFSEIKAALPGAEFQLRQHSAQCESAPEPEIRRGVIAKFRMGRLTFKREFELTRANVSSEEWS